MYWYISFIVIDRVVGAPGHGKYVVDGLNAIEKWIFKLSMTKLLNPELICDGTNFSSLCRFMTTNNTKIQV